MKNSKVIESGSVELNPRIEMLLKHAKQFGPIEVKITSKDIKRLKKVKSEDQKFAFRMLLQERIYSEVQLARGLVSLESERELT